MKLKVNMLVQTDCFQFKQSGFNLGEGWQKTTLYMVLDVKQYLRRKAPLVAGGYLAEMLDIPIHFSKVKEISVRLLHVIAHNAGLKQLCGDIMNAYPNAETNEKVFVSRAGVKFGNNKCMEIIMSKALYGLG